MTVLAPGDLPSMTWSMPMRNVELMLQATRVSGYDVPQSTVQLAILQQLSSLIRAGNYTGSFGPPSKLVHVGHSYGSLISNGLIATTPGLSDGVILTGISYSKIQEPFLKHGDFGSQHIKHRENGQAGTTTI